MNYKERLNSLYNETLHKSRYTKRNVFVTPTLDPMASLNEYGSWVRSFMQKFGIGKYLSATKWGASRRSKIRKRLADSIEDYSHQKRLPTAHNLYDDIKTKVGKDVYSGAEIAVAARTEAARMRTVFQLLKWQEAGLKYVRYQTKTDIKVRDGHSKFNGRIFEIDWLLRPENDMWRIPMNSDSVGGPYNCRCVYRMFLGEPRGRLNNVG